MSTEQTQTTGNTTQSTDAGATATSGNPADQGQQQQQTQQADATQGGQQSAGTDQATGSTTEGTKAAEQPQGAPEKYEFKAPEDVTFDPQVIGEFEGVARELNLPQDKAQKVLDKMAPLIAKRQSENMQAQIDTAKKGWEAQVRSDKEFGGDAIDANLGIAEKALDTFGTPELKTLLKQTGMSHHPEVIRLLWKAGKAISESGTVVTGNSPGQGKTAQSFYSASNMNP
jgi:hypothetical protein